MDGLFELKGREIVVIMLMAMAVALFTYFAYNAAEQRLLALVTAQALLESRSLAWDVCGFEQEHSGVDEQRDQQGKRYLL